MKLTTSPGLLAVSLLLVLPAPPATAQSSPVRAVSEELHQYLSPMVLELDLSEFLALPPGKTWNPEAIKRFSCRWVTFERFSLTALPDDPRKVAVLAFLKNNGGKDKRVQMTFTPGESCVLKISPDETGICRGALIQSNPAVRLTVTVGDY